MDVERLNTAFYSFTAASKSLEACYGQLQEKVNHLTLELEKKNIELNEALTEAERNKDYLNAILYNLEEAIIVVDPEDKIVMINKSAKELLCLDPMGTVGKKLRDQNFVLKKEGSETYLSVSGKNYPVIISHSDIVDSEGMLKGRVILIKDITKLRDIEIWHERNQRLIAMGEMAVKIVHEIRNPLCSIELFSSMLEKELEGTDQQKLARGISTGINNLNNILTNMLFFARPHKPAINAIRLNKVIEDTIGLLAPLMDSRRVLIKKICFEREISGDTELLKQVFLNVIINSIQSMPDGGKIEVIMKENAESVSVDFSDTGNGISEKDKERIFDPFFSTKDNGTGLGLTIASKIMQAHGGFIMVFSEEGKGSRFSLHFPLKETI